MATSQSLAQALSEIIDYDPYGNVITSQPTSSTSLLGNTTNTAANQIRRIPYSFEGDSSDVPGLSPQTLGFLAQETPYDNEGRMMSIDRGLQTMAGFLPVAGFVNQLPTYLSSPLVGAFGNIFGGKNPNPESIPVESRGGNLTPAALASQQAGLAVAAENEAIAAQAAQAAAQQSAIDAGYGNESYDDPGEAVAADAAAAAAEQGEFAHGGKVNRGQLRGPDPKGPDEGYASLQSGEYVIKRDAVRKYGEGMLGKINAGKYAPRG